MVKTDSLEKRNILQFVRRGAVYAYLPVDGISTREKAFQEVVTKDRMIMKSVRHATGCEFI